VALGGDCLSDLAEVRAEPGLYGPVASDPTVSRLIALLGDNAERAEKAISRARKAARARVWALAGPHAPNAGISAADPLIIDVDATLVTAHSDKQEAAPTFKKGYGHHPLCAFIDHGAAGSGEMAAVMLRPGNAGSNTGRRPHHRDPGRPWTRPESARGPAGRSWSASMGPDRPTRH
jgi:hypothetical protein